MEDEISGTYDALCQSVVDMDEPGVVNLATEALANGFEGYDLIEKGLSVGMKKAGILFEEEVYFVPELLLCADAMYAGLEVIKPHLRENPDAAKAKVVIGVIEGDTHDIGKNLVKIMLEVSGCEIYDLGRDIPPAVFVDKALEYNVDIIAISTLMTTTMPRMAQVINILKERNIREQFKVIVGGGPISKSFADSIGADGYSANANNAISLVQNLLTEKQV